MKITDKWEIKGGHGDYVLIETRLGKNPKTGEPTTTEHKTYHPSLEHCAAKISKATAIDAVELDAIEAVQDQISELQAQIVELIGVRND